MFTDAQNTALAVIVFVYFLFLVVLAAVINRRVKTYEDYSVAGRTVSVFPMILTLIGTAIGGSILLGYMTNGFALGMGQIWLALVAVIPSIILVTVLAKPIRRIGEHHGMVTLGDFTALVYGKHARIPTAISMLFAYCAITGMQFVSIALILNLTTGMDVTIGILVSWVMLTIKTVLGGLKAVVFQDALHGTLQTVGIFALFVVVIIVSGGWDNIQANAKAVDAGQMMNVFNIPPAELAVLFLTVGGYQFVRQDLWQRMWASKTMKVLTVSFWVAIVLQTLIGVAVVLLGVMGRFGLQLTDADPALIYYEIIGAVFPFPLVVIMLIALLATVISTADSFFLAGSSSIVNDIIKPRLADQHSPKLLTYSKLAVLLTSVVALIMALYIPQLIVLWVTGTAMLVSGLLAPVICGLFWKGVTRAGGLAAMWSGLVIAVIWQLTGEPFGWHPVFVGLPVSIVVLIAVSLATQSTNTRTESWYSESKRMLTEEERGSTAAQPAADGGPAQADAPRSRLE
ncbi:sodium:solute symporter family protein [Brevibacterium luteolum]|uniref:sodium:solute symporter family protein n=1 Tax=Brevibacterium luteolum TaxID=199591 RepID=UPI00223C4F15|nr:sodium:solute symporter family protein [Brevibacterium luteolum]MCT1920339.1 sodium:solute symporter family protein [Brevibacterium luteolum]